MIFRHQAYIYGCKTETSKQTVCFKVKVFTSPWLLFGSGSLIGSHLTCAGGSQVAPPPPDTNPDLLLIKHEVASVSLRCTGKKKSSHLKWMEVLRSLTAPPGGARTVSSRSLPSGFTQSPPASLGTRTNFASRSGSLCSLLCCCCCHVCCEYNDVYHSNDEDLVSHRFNSF